MSRQKPQASKSATQADIDEMDEVWLFQAIDALIDRENLDGLMRARSRIEEAINKMQMKKFAEKTEGVRNIVGGILGKVNKAKKAIKNI